MTKSKALTSLDHVVSTKKQGLVVLSLFDGISAAQVALKNLNIPVKIYYASEIDTGAIKVTQSNFPKTVQLGDVTELNGKNLPKIDLLIGGSPCQDLSVMKSATRQGLKGDKSKLFWHFVRIKKEVNPKWFLLENVGSMRDSDKNKITKALRVKPVLINSADFSAQQRNRYYWSNINIPAIKSISKECIADILEKPIKKTDCIDKIERVELLPGTNFKYKRSIYNIFGKSPALLANDYGVKYKKPNQKNHKSFTPVESERLQKFPDNYTKIVGDTKRYKLLGQSFTVNVIEHILKPLKAKGKGLGGYSIDGYYFNFLPRPKEKVYTNTKNINELKVKVNNWLLENVRNKAFVNHDTGYLIEVNDNAIGKWFSEKTGPEKTKALTAIDEIIKVGIKVGQEPEKNNDKNVIAVYKFISIVEVERKIYPFLFLVDHKKNIRKNSNTDKFIYRVLFIPDEKKPDNDLSGLYRGNTDFRDRNPLFKQIYGENYKKFKEENSKQLGDTPHNQLEIIDYSAKSIALKGTTKALGLTKDLIKEKFSIWSTYNRSLKHPKTNEKFGGWIFRKDDKNKVLELISQFGNSEKKPIAQPQKSNYDKQQWNESHHSDLKKKLAILKLQQQRLRLIRIRAKLKANVSKTTNESVTTEKGSKTGKKSLKGITFKDYMIKATNGTLLKEYDFESNKMFEAIRRVLERDTQKFNADIDTYFKARYLSEIRSVYIRLAMKFFDTDQEIAEKMLNSQPSIKEKLLMSNPWPKELKTFVWPNISPEKFIPKPSRGKYYNNSEIASLRYVYADFRKGDNPNITEVVNYVKKLNDFVQKQSLDLVDSRFYEYYLSENLFNVFRSFVFTGSWEAPFEYEREKYNFKDKKQRTFENIIAHYNETIPQLYAKAIKYLHFRYFEIFDIKEPQKFIDRVQDVRPSFSRSTTDFMLRVRYGIDLRYISERYLEKELKKLNDKYPKAYINSRRASGTVKDAVLDGVIPIKEYLRLYEIGEQRSKKASIEREHEINLMKLELSKLFNKTFKPHYKPVVRNISKALGNKYEHKFGKRYNREILNQVWVKPRGPLLFEAESEEALIDAIKNYELPAKKGLGEVPKNVKAILQLQQQRLRFLEIKHQGLGSWKNVNKAFNEELQKFKENKAVKLFSLGFPSVKLIQAGLKNLHIWLKKVTVVKKIKQHEITLNNLKDLPKKLANPIMVFLSNTVENAFVILIEERVNNKSVVVAIHLVENKNSPNTYEVTSVHERSSELHFLNWAKDGLLLYADKKKVQKWLRGSRYNSEQSKQLLDIITKLNKNNSNSIDGIPTNVKAILQLQQQRLRLIRIREREAKNRLATSTPKAVQTDVQAIPLSKININKELFQNRESDYSNESTNKIIQAVENGTFNWAVFDPILLWKSPSGKLFVLSGHSRTAAFKELAKRKAKVAGKKFDTIPAKIIEVSQDEAVKIALESNTLATQETDTERANYYRKLRDKGTNKTEISELAKSNEGKNWRKILNLSFLNPNGFLIDSLKAVETSDEQSKGVVNTIADWIGEARGRNPQLTNSHEKEMANWLLGGAYGNKAGQIKNKRIFLEKLNNAIMKNTEFGKFDQDKLLNLKNTMSLSPVEQAYNAQVEELKEQLKEADKLLKAKTTEFFGGVQDGKITKSKAQELILPYQAAFSNIQRKLTQLLSKKSEVMQESKKQGSLFGLGSAKFLKRFFIKNKLKMFFRNAIKNPTNKKSQKVIKKLTEKDVERIKKHTAIDLTGYSFTVDNFSIIHIFNRHGNKEKEAEKGQIAVNEKNFPILINVLELPDKIYEDKINKRNVREIVFEKMMYGKHYYVSVQEVRPKKKTLSLKTMRIFNKENKKKTP